MEPTSRGRLGAGRKRGHLRVLHVQKATGIAGSERHLLTLLPALQARGLEIKICVLVADHGDDFVAALRRAGIDTVALAAGPNANPLVVARLSGEIRKFRPDIVHTHLIHADIHGQLAARLTRVPGVQSVHATHPFMAKWPLRAVAALAGHSARRVIAISQHVHAFIESLGLARRERIHVVHYGIDQGSWEMSADERAEARAGFGFAPDEVIVGVASRLFPNKGHDFLIESFARARRSTPNLKLAVAGDGPLREELGMQASRSLQASAFEFRGFVPDIARFMGACDVMTFPTMPGFGEGFGLAALEGMAAGRPVIATALDSLPEIVLEGITGALVRPGDFDAFADLLASLASDRSTREAMGRAARDRVRDTFSVEEMTSKTIATYEAALQE